MQHQGLLPELAGSCAEGKVLLSSSSLWIWLWFSPFPIIRLSQGFPELQRCVFPADHPSQWISGGCKVGTGATAPGKPEPPAALVPACFIPRDFGSRTGHCLGMMETPRPGGLGKIAGIIPKPWE